MVQPRDDFPKHVADALAKRAAFICSNPECRALTIAPSEIEDSKFLYIGKAAHICAAAVGGPRYDARMTPEERKAASNGVFLCSNCADMIDKNSGLDFPVALLKGWKDAHEQWVGANLNKRQSTQQQAVTFNVASVGQQGGITAGVVNVGPRRRNIDGELKARLLGLLPDKSKTVSITALLGDSEAMSFAAQIGAYLKSEGYSVKGPGEAIFGRYVPPLEFNPGTHSLNVGASQ